MEKEESIKKAGALNSSQEFGSISMDKPEVTHEELVAALNVNMKVFEAYAKGITKEPQSVVTFFSK